MMLRSAGADSSFANCAAPFMGSIALNNILPLRMGDVVRALLFPKAMGITKTNAASSLIMERLFDLMTLLICLGIGLFAIQNTIIPPALKNYALLLTVVGGTTLLTVFLFSGSFARLSKLKSNINGSGQAKGRAASFFLTISNFLYDIEKMSRLRFLLIMTAISMLVWIGESGLFYFILLGFGLDANPVTGLLVMSVATLATLVPSSPGYVGPFHLAAFTVISLVGATPSQAGGYAVLVHLALWASTTIVGSVAIWSRPELFQSVRRHAI